jgi:hypothetical protein
MQRQGTAAAAVKILLLFFFCALQSTGAGVGSTLPKYLLSLLIIKKINLTKYL